EGDGKVDLLFGRTRDHSMLERRAGDSAPYPQRLTDSVECPQSYRIAVLDDDAIARENRIGVSRAVRDFVAGDLLVLLVARFERDQLRGWSERHKNRAGIHNGSK